MNPDQLCRTVMSVCAVSQERARQLLEAATGSVERAIEIHFAQNRQVLGTTDDDDDGMTPIDVASLKSDRKVQAMTPESKIRGYLKGAPPTSSPCKRTIPSSKKQSPPSQKQRKIDTFFTSPVSSSKGKAKQVNSGVKPSASTAADTENSGSNIAASTSFSLSQQEKQSSNVETALVMSGTSWPNPRPTENKTITSMPSSNHDCPTVPYSLLAGTFAQMAATTKRNVKLQLLKNLFVHVLQKCRGGGCEGYDRDNNNNNKGDTNHNDHLLLTRVLELTLGKITIQQSDKTRKSNHAPSAKSRSTSSQPVPLQVSGSSISTAIQQVTGVSRKQQTEMYRQMGDLGDVAAHFYVDQAFTIQKFLVVVSPQNAANTTTATKCLSVSQVHHMLSRIATVSAGKGSQATRQNLVVRLLRECRDKEEMRFVVRTLLGNMRLGATIKTVLAGLAMAVNEMDDTWTTGSVVGAKGQSSSEQCDSAQRLQKIYHVCPRLNEISRALVKGGLAYAEEVCTLAVGFPVEPMLANPAQSLEQVEKFLGNERGVAEWKYDGVRCQAHWDGKEVKLYSRHLLDCTEQFPDAVKYMIEARNPNVYSFILDAEIVGVVPTAKPDGTTSFRLLPFQDLSTRRSTKEKVDQVQVRVYSFDLMHLNGESLLKQPHHIRLAKLRSSFGETEGFALAQSVPLLRYDETLVQSTLQKAIEQGAEGLMIKLSGTPPAEMTPNPPATIRRTYGYEAGTRSQLWLKLKKDYVSGFFDTIDVVPVGAWFGTGRKAQRGFLSPILLAVYDEDEGVFQSVSRCMSFSDDMYTAMREFYFRGTPYPSGVGIVEESCLADEKVAGNLDLGPKKRPQEVQSADEKKPDTVYDKETNASSEPSGDEDDSVNENGVAIAAGDERDRINCFPTRPPTTVVVTNENPTIWIKPSEVWEVSFADLSLSRTHTAARDQLDDAQGRGIALRFPRFKRRRPDKSIEEATTTRQLAELFAAQTKFL